MVDASIKLYNTLLKELLPTPAKPHYTFNMRDLAAVVQGVLYADTKTVLEPASLVRLWVRLGLYKILFQSLLWESTIRLVPPPICKAYHIAILLHDGLTPPLGVYQDRARAGQPSATMGAAQRM